MTVNKISNSKISAIKRKSAYALPDNPTGSGMNAEKIKNAFWTFAIDENDSIVAEIQRIIDEINTDIGSKENYSNKGVTIADNTSNTSKFPTAKDVADFVQSYAEPGLIKNTAFNKNFETNASNIKSNGSVNVGSLSTIARADHVHPFSDAETFAENERVKSNNSSYGAIVHQKEMEAFAQPLIRYADFVRIETLTQTTLEGFVTYFKENHPKCFRCGIGSVENSNFKTLVGTPTGFGQYVTCTIIPEQFSTGAGNIYKLFAFNSNGSKMAVGYIGENYVSSTQTNLYFTGWNVLN